MAKQLTRSAVRIYGALSALGNDSGSVLESLLPFFDPILRQHNGEKFKPDTIAEAIRKSYKWNFNSDVVETFVPYLENHGWIVADIAGAKNTSYTIQVAENDEPDAAVHTVEAELRRIATQFKEFSENLSPLTVISLKVEEFEDILVEWLLYIEAFSETSIGFQSGLEPDAAEKPQQVAETPNTTSLKDEEKFLCARFVRHAIEENQSTAEVLARIAAIGLLTEVVQDFVKPVTSVDKADLVVYLDAPVAMGLLGVSGKAERENTAPIVAELIRIGASIRIFGQSLDEIKNSLQAVLKSSCPTGPTAQALIKQEVLREYVNKVSLDPVYFLGLAKVKATYRTRKETPSEYRFFTRDNWRDLYSRLSYLENTHAREHDTDITTFVVRQRQGRTSRDIFKSHAIMLTRNSLLAEIGRHVCTEISGLPSETVPPIIHRRVLATAMWLRTGMGPSDLNIPKRMLLAGCEQVLAIRPGVVDAVKRLTDALGDEEKTRQLDLLITQDRSVQALMDKTLGVSNVVTEENFPLLWQEMLHPHLEKERQKRLEAVSKAKAKGEKQLEKANQKIETMQREREEEAASLGARLETNQREDRDSLEALCIDVESILRRKKMTRVFFGVTLALIGPVSLSMDTTPLVQWTAFVTGSVSGYLTITGGRLVKIRTSEKQAIELLQSTAERRKLLGKLNQFDVSWNMTAFVLEDRSELPSSNAPEQTKH